MQKLGAIALDSPFSYHECFLCLKSERQTIDIGIRILDGLNSLSIHSLCCGCKMAFDIGIEVVCFLRKGPGLLLQVGSCCLGDLDCILYMDYDDAISISDKDVIDLADAMEFYNFKPIETESISDSTSNNERYILSEYDRIVQSLRRTGGNRARTAKELGISTATLWRIMKRLKEDHPDIFRANFKLQGD